MVATIENRIFEYRARRTDGSEATGRAAAADELDLDRQLQRDGLTLVEAAPAKGAEAARHVRIPSRELVAFTNQLATMLHAGLPILQSLRHIERHTRSAPCRRVTRSLLQRIEGGESLAEAMAAHPETFSGTYVAMVRSGELSTQLPDVLKRQGAYLDWVREVRSMTKQAMIYPSALGLALVGLVLILLTFLIPRIVGLFPGGEEDLPGQTKFVLAVSDFVVGNWVELLSGAAALAATWWTLLRIPRARLQLSRASLALPRIGGLLEMLAVARFATTAAALHTAGCDIVKTLDIAGESCGNAWLRSCFARVLEAVRGGDPIHVGMERVGCIDPYLVQLTAVGESSGRLGECLENLADGYNAEVPRNVKWVLSLVEPTVIVGGGVVVAFLLLAAILPIFKIYETLG
ncbi:MAG: type II secretion system F family protein [Planctomycetota bacterium]